MRQRLGLEHVERGGVELAGRQTGGDVGVDLQPAAAGVDQHRARQPRVASPPRQLGEQPAIQDAVRVRRQRQQHRQDVGIGQEGIELSRPRVAGHALERLGRAAPAPHLVAEYPERARRGRAQHA